MSQFDKIKYIIKISVAGFLYYTGILHLVRFVRLRNKAVVLMYHRVLGQKEKNRTFSHPGIIVDKNTFDRQMAYLKKSFHVISEEDFLHHLKNDIPFPPNSCLITFDDGWQDNYTNAYPILKKQCLPATIFLATDYIGTGRQFWQEKLAATLFSIYQQEKTESIVFLKKHGLKNIFRLPADSAKMEIRRFIARLKKLKSPELSTLLTTFFNIETENLRGEENIDVFLNWDHVDEMYRNGISFGSHSVHHHILTGITHEELEEEIRLSRETISAHIGFSPKIFCYPNGNYSDQIAEQVSDAGYLAALSTATGYVDHKSNLYAISRINIHNEVTNSTPLFISRILGLF
jgi:peptidoglycan/xylan/chitin deacetylase (PgdA/CDA1 family)